VDYVRHWSQRTEIPGRRFIRWLGIAQSKFHDWQKRYGLVNEHNALVPRDWWLEDWEKQAILAFHADHLLDGYRRLAFMMLDADVVAVSPSSVYRVLRDAGLMKRHNCKPSLKGKGFDQPTKPHEHWHVDLAYINVAGTFFFLCTLLDGYSRSIVHWEIRMSMTESEVETIIQRARERFPHARPRIISDNGPQFVAKDFKEFIRICGMTHVRTSADYPQTKGYASSCTSFVFSEGTCGNRRGSDRLMPCILSGPFSLTGSYKYSGLSLPTWALSSPPRRQL
jgi:putative transposase